MNKLRQAVSLQKRRYQKDGFDLDLTYITPCVVAMGYPSTGTEAAFRNPAKECKRFLDLKHQQHYRVYNLCSGAQRRSMRRAAQPAFARFAAHLAAAACLFAHRTQLRSDSL